MTPPRSAETPLLISRSAANERFRDALRLFVGRGRRYSVKTLSNATGIKDRMIEAFMAPIDSTEYRKPDIEEVLTLMTFLRDGFASELIGIADLGAFELPDGGDTPPGALAVEMSQDAATVTRLAVGGEASNRDELRQVGKRAMACGATLVRLAA